jgi:hypothetical protein
MFHYKIVTVNDNDDGGGDDSNNFKSYLFTAGIAQSV